MKGKKYIALEAFAKLDLFWLENQYHVKMSRDATVFLRMCKFNGILKHYLNSNAIQRKIMRLALHINECKSKGLK